MISLFKPFVPELDKIQDVLCSGKLAYGDFTMRFEEELKDYFMTNNIMALNSFDAAINICLQLLDIHEGDEVIMSPMCCLVSSQPYRAKNLKVVWADVNPKTGTLDPESVKKRITKRTKLIIHNHFCGYPGFIDEINSIGMEYHIPVIDDCIEAFGTEYKGKKIGNVGTDFTIFSLSPVRFPNTIDGSILIIKDDEKYRKALLMADLGIDRKKFRLPNGEINPKCDIVIPGFNSKMNNVCGYIGLEQMKNCCKVLNLQRQNGKFLHNIFANNGDFSPIINDNGLPNYWVFGLLVQDKNIAINTLKKYGISASGVHINNNLYSVFGESEFLPGVDYFSNHFIAIPSGWFVKEEDYAHFLKGDE